jgi:hypothetical protein
VDAGAVARLKASEGENLSRKLNINQVVKTQQTEQIISNILPDLSRRND